MDAAGLAAIVFQSFGRSHDRTSQIVTILVGDKSLSPRRRYRLCVSADVDSHYAGPELLRASDCKNIEQYE